MKHILIVLSLVMTLGFLGCSNSGPSTDQVINDVKVAIKNDAFIITTGGLFKTVPYDIVSVSKSNGMKNGSEGYKIEAEYELKFKEDSKVISDELIFPKDKTADRVAGLQLSNDISNRFGDFKKGETKKYKKWFAYVKTENGWKLAF